MVNQDAIQDGELNDIKLPKAVTQFINDIEKQVKQLITLEQLEMCMYMINTI